MEGVKISLLMNPGGAQHLFSTIDEFELEDPDTWQSVTGKDSS